MTAPAITVNLSATLNSSAGPIAIGDVLVPVGGLYVKATAANLALGGRAHGVALTAWSSTASPGAVQLQHVGIVDAAVTGLGAGSASWVRVSTLGRLERAAVSGSDDVVGWCSSDGTMFALFGLLTAGIANGFIPPTGTGLPHIVAGSFSPVASLVVDADVSASAAIAASKVVQATGTGLPHVVAGVLNAASSLVVNADVDPAAAIASSKIAPPGSDKGVLFNNAGALAASGVVSINEAGQEFDIVTAAQATLARLTNYAGASANGANIVLNKARGTLAAPTRALLNDQFGGVLARAYFDDGGSPGFGPATAAGFTFRCAEDQLSTSQGNYFVLNLTRIGTTSTNEVWRVDGYGKHTITCRPASSGSNGTLQIISSNHTNQTASTELTDCLYDGSLTLQFATGNITTQRQFLVKARTYSAVAASVITNAATHVVDKAPVAGTNVTITNAYSYWAQAGLAKFDGGVSTTTLVLSSALTSANGGTDVSAPGTAGNLLVSTGSAWSSASYASQRGTALDANHLHAWELNESSGSFIDTGSSVSKVNLAIITNPIYATPGLFGPCAQFGMDANGASAHSQATVLTSAFSDLPTASCTIEYWYKAYTATASQRAVSFAATAGAVTNFELLTTGASGTWTGVSNAVALKTTSMLLNQQCLNNVWNHIALVYDSVGGTVTTYFNGEAYAQATGQSGSILWNTGTTPTLTVGKGLGASTDFIGQLSKLRLSNIARSHAYCQAVYKAGGLL